MLEVNPSTLQQKDAVEHDALRGEKYNAKVSEVWHEIWLIMVQGGAGPLISLRMYLFPEYARIATIEGDSKRNIREIYLASYYNNINSFE